MMKCKICNQPIRVIPTGSKLKDAYNKVVLVIGHVCMKCAIAYKDAAKEADSMTYEERAVKTMERMKAQGMTQKQVEEAVKMADVKEAEISVELTKQKVNIQEHLDEPVQGVSREEIEKKNLNKGENKMVEAYCMKEKVKRTMKNPVESVNKRGVKVVSGVCEKCGTKMFKILGKK